MFGVLLFVIYCICLSQFVSTSEVKLNEKVTLPAQTIEQQLKEVLWSDAEPEEKEQVTTVTEVNKKPATIANLLEGIEVEKLTLRKARKVAKALDIRQKVNSKDQPKKWILAQIAKKLKANPTEVAPIIVEQVQAA